MEKITNQVVTLLPVAPSVWYGRSTTPPHCVRYNSSLFTISLKVTLVSSLSPCGFGADLCFDRGAILWLPALALVPV